MEVFSLVSKNSNFLKTNQLRWFLATSMKDGPRLPSFMSNSPAFVQVLNAALPRRRDTTAIRCCFVGVNYNFHSNHQYIYKGAGGGAKSESGERGLGREERRM